MKGGMGNMMKQAQMMQANMQKAQQELAEMEVTGSAGGGLVTLTMTCRYDVRKVVIDPDLFDDDKEIVEDLIAAAMNDAVKKVEETTQEKMSAITGGMGGLGGMPGMNMPF